jgi:hypothetical protein
LLRQVGDLFELNVKLRCQKVKILGFTGIAGLQERSQVSRIIQIYDYRYVARHFNPLISSLAQDTAQSRLQCNNSSQLFILRLLGKEYFMYWLDSVLRLERSRVGLQTTRHPSQTEDLVISILSTRMEDDI